MRTFPRANKKGKPVERVSSHQPPFLFFAPDHAPAESMTRTLSRAKRVSDVYSLYRMEPHILFLQVNTPVIDGSALKPLKMVPEQIPEFPM